MVEGRIENRPEALNQMMNDLAGYQGPLGPGPYWADNQQTTLKWLRDKDLNTFRKFEPTGKALANFGGGSWWPAMDETRKEQTELSRNVLNKAFQKLHFRPGIDFFGKLGKRTSQELRLRHSFLMYLEALCRARDVDGTLDRIAATLVGAPSDALDMNGLSYTPNFLISFLRYLDMKEHIDFDDVESYVEVGPGAGLFVEVLAKIKPELRVYLIDIPPQLYVLQQVLRGIFGNEVATYEEIKAEPSVLRVGQRRIFVLAPWQIDLVSLEGVGLAHNSGFGEMRKDTVEAYLAYFKKWRAKYIYICALDTRKTPQSIKADEYVDLLPDHVLVARTATRSAASLGPLDAAGRKIDVRPASDICFKRRDLAA